MSSSHVPQTVTTGRCLITCEARESSIGGVHGLRGMLTAVDRATEMDVTMIGLQNAGKTSLLRVLAVRSFLGPKIIPGP